MNSQKARDIIKLYKFHFKEIHKEEIYKWRAVKCFKDNWDFHTPDFHTMLGKSLALTKNLTASGKYFPKRMLLKIAKEKPDEVRVLFKELFNEQENLIDRIELFQQKIKGISKKLFGELNDYQDPRAVIVYLTLNYPDIYYLYKYKMFEDFVPMVDYPYKPKTGDIENITQFLTLCSILKEEIVKDRELLDLHKTRITSKEYFDPSYNILTQDVIYAAVRHINKFAQKGKQDAASQRLIKTEVKLSQKIDDVVLKGSFTNYIENEKENKRIGDLGELLVLQYEQEKLKALGVKKSPEHKAKSEGDGIGYDILSYNEKGKPIYIEVKTSTGNCETPFYITANELHKSKEADKDFLLYRLFDFNDINNTAKYYTRQGDLTSLCVNPKLYVVSLKKV